MLAIAALVITALVPASLRGSSHREAPLIAKDPTADNTDLYAYVTPDEMSTVTIIANFIPVEEPTGGPYFHNFDDNVLYEIKVDNRRCHRHRASGDRRRLRAVRQQPVRGPDPEQRAEQ